MPATAPVMHAAITPPIIARKPRLASTGISVSEKIIEYFHRKFQEEVKLESFNLKDIKIDPQRGFENLLDLRKMTEIGVPGGKHGMVAAG